MSALKKKKSALKDPDTVISTEVSAGICDNMNFATAEAYKMLRTKINLVATRTLSNSDDHRCRIIGITSAIRGEGKSTTAVNLAYTIAEASHNVCLIEADMRLPNLAKRLDLNKAPGLSNLLTGQVTVQETMQTYISEKGVRVYAITAGDIPPTPSELLESPNMEALLDAFSKTFDYIIVDLPPITAVTDPLSVSHLLDGMLLVVRKNYCDKRFLKDAISQLKLAKTKVLGVVFNCSDGSTSGDRVSKRYKQHYNYNSSSSK